MTGFKTVLERYKEEGFARLELDQVTEEDCFEKDVYDFCRYLIEHDVDEGMFYVLSYLRRERAELVTYSSAIRKAHSDPRVLAKELSARVVRKAKSMVPRFWAESCNAKSKRRHAR